MMGWVEREKEVEVEVGVRKGKVKEGRGGGDMEREVEWCEGVGRWGGGGRDVESGWNLWAFGL